MVVEYGLHAMIMNAILKLKRKIYNDFLKIKNFADQKFVLTSIPRNVQALCVFNKSTYVYICAYILAFQVYEYMERLKTVVFGNAYIKENFLWSCNLN